MFIPTLYFARIRSFPQFKTAFGLNLQSSNKVWLAILWMMLIQSLALIAAHWGLPNRGLNTPNMTTANSSEVILYFLPFLIAPFWEEIVMRGFFYQAFRGSYSKQTSTLLVVAITALTHQSQFFGSILAAVGLSGFVVILCWLMERTNRIWNCILGHLTFNGIFILTSFYAPLNHATAQFMIAFCTCSRFSASSKIVSAWASSVSSSISLPR